MRGSGVIHRMAWEEVRQTALVGEQLACHILAVIPFGNRMAPAADILAALEQGTGLANRDTLLSESRKAGPSPQLAYAGTT